MSGQGVLPLEQTSRSGVLSAKQDENKTSKRRLSLLKRRTGRPGVFLVRLGVILCLSSVVILYHFSDHAIIRAVLIRIVYSELLVHLTLTVISTFIRTSFHLLLLAVYFVVLLYMNPELQKEPELPFAVAAVVLAPLGVYVCWKGIVSSQLDRTLGREYWTLESDRSEAKPMRATRSPLSVVLLLGTTKQMMQLLEVTGLDTHDKRALVNARNHFLYRVRHSSRFQHKVIAAERLFHSVGTVIARRTTSQIVQPNGPVNRTINIVQDEMTFRVLRQAEAILKPLPRSLEPTSLLKLGALCVVSLLTHKRFFKYVKTVQQGTLHPGLQASKYLTRFGILIYLTGRYTINMARSGRPSVYSDAPFTIRK